MKPCVLTILLFSTVQPHLAFSCQQCICFYGVWQCAPLDFTMCVVATSYQHGFWVPTAVLAATTVAFLPVMATTTAISLLPLPGSFELGTASDFEMYCHLCCFFYFFVCCLPHLWIYPGYSCLLLSALISGLYPGYLFHYTFTHSSLIYSRLTSWCLP